VFGDQYLWVEAMLAEDGIRVTKRPDNIPELARQFGRSEIALRDAWERKVHQLVEREREKDCHLGGRRKRSNFCESDRSKT